LNFTQLAKHKKLVKRRTHPRLEFECITISWHWKLGANARSFVLVLEVEHVVDGKPKILYEGVYQGDEVVVLV
jgi:hypothetical protein